ncbi:MAG: LicD family protein [Prevotella sp.]|nr:LicD family protein [Prevotella sp.]
MASYNLRQLHQSMLGILKAIDKACDEHGLRYYITAGTMLGAIRHKGFIPWDDDADICMPRPDYERLIAHAKEWLPERYELICAENDASYPLAFAKLQDANTTIIERAHLHYLGGVYIDVFPIDGVPSNTLSRYWHMWKYKLLRKKLYLTHRDPYRHGHGPSSWVPLLCHKLYTVPQIQANIRKLLLKYDYDQSQLVQDYDDGYNGHMEKSILGKPTNYEFEGEQLKGYEQYDAYLKKKYGDYMTPPPAPKQRQHNFHYLNLELPYREYKEK